MVGRRRSNIVILSLIGAAGVLVGGANAFPGTEMRRNLYASRADCERDCPPSQCEQTSSSPGGGGGYRGPVYAADRSSAAAHGDPGTGRTGFHAAVETSYRGGFGTFGRGIRAGA